jgi:hypothetical protein
MSLERLESHVPRHQVLTRPLLLCGMPDSSQHCDCLEAAAMHFTHPVHVYGPCKDRSPYCTACQALHGLLGDCH